MLIIDSRIIWLLNILALSVPDEDYSRNSSCVLNLKSIFLLDDDNKGLQSFSMQEHMILSPFMPYTIRERERERERERFNLP